MNFIRLITYIIRKIRPTYKINHKGNLALRKNVYIDNPECVLFGRNCFVNYGCNFHTGYSETKPKITIGDNVFFGMNVCVTCVSHNIGSSNARAKYENTTYQDIYIGTGTWVGASVTILQGVHIGNGCVIAAGSVVISDVPDNTMYGGVPAKFIKGLE